MGRLNPNRENKNTVEYYNIGNKKEKGNNYQQTNILKNPYDSLIVTIANKENIDPHLIRCIIKVESNFNKDAVSVAGAMG
jgi:soluble lytic murein transglycosylase-like protein